MACMDWQSRCRNAGGAVNVRTRISGKGKPNLKYHLMQFHHCHCHSEAFGGAMTEDQSMSMKHLFQAGFVAGQPSLGSEDIWIGAVNLVKLGSPCVEPNERSSRDTLSFHSVTLGRYYALS